MAIEFNREEFEKMEQPVIFAISSCKANIYGGIQLSATPTTHYYFNPDIPGFEELQEQYIFKALLTDQSATALVTFFTPNADVLTGSSCTDLVKKYGVPDPREFPDEILSLNGRTHIFQVHYNPSCVQGRVDFYFDDILDKPLQIAGPSQSSEPSTVTPLPITPETPTTPAEQPTASTAASIGLTEGVSSHTPLIPTTSSETTTKNVKRALFETGSAGESKKKRNNS
ncbi:DNA helicase [Tanacetum coccineum]